MLWSTAVTPKYYIVTTHKTGAPIWLRKVQNFPLAWRWLFFLVLQKVLGQLPTKDNSPPDRNKAQPLPTGTTIPRTTVEPRYNEVLGTMKITLLYQVSHYIRVKNKEIWRAGTSKITLLLEGFVISDLFITRFHCTPHQDNSALRPLPRNKTTHQDQYLYSGELSWWGVVRLRLQKFLLHTMLFLSGCPPCCDMHINHLLVHSCPFEGCVMLQSPACTAVLTLGEARSHVKEVGYCACDTDLGGLVITPDGTLCSSLTPCLPSSTFGTSAGSPDLTFGTNTVAMHTELSYCIALMDTMALFGAYRKHSQYSHCHLYMYIYTGELPALSFFLIFQLGYTCRCL